MILSYMRMKILKYINIYIYNRDVQYACIYVFIWNSRKVRDKCDEIYVATYSCDVISSCRLDCGYDELSVEKPGSHTQTHRERGRERIVEIWQEDWLSLLIIGIKCAFILKIIKNIN